jgi:predicted O-linked N-acetylglucosamine transferase (SPINDLY family)
MQKYCFSHPNTTVPPCDPEPPCVKNGYITFGCFNTLGKIDNYTAKLWSRLLKEIPNAKLLIYRTQLSDDFKARISEMLEQNGADMQRVMFRNDKQSPHFLIYGEADIALDPVPFSGLTVTIETILMGVPVLCKKHETLQSKGTSRVNYSLGLDELVAEDEEDFIAKAKRLADVDVIKKYRESLRYKLVTSSIFTDYGIAADFEDCIDRAWQEWCK